MSDLSLDTRLLTASELADFLGVSTKTVTRWAREGKGPTPYYINGSPRFAEGDVIDWVKSQQEQEETTHASN